MKRENKPLHIGQLAKWYIGVKKDRPSNTERPNKIRTEMQEKYTLCTNTDDEQKDDSRNGNGWNEGGPKTW